IPATGKERLARMQAAVDHEAAVVGLSTVVRDNADARIARTALGHEEVRLAYAGVPVSLGDDHVGNSADNLAKVTAEETQIKRDALKDGKAAATESETLRRQMIAELDATQAKLPKPLRERQASDVQAYKDALAVQQVRTHGTVADLGADIDPKEALAQLERGS